jgi:hypothetical protein
MLFSHRKGLKKYSKEVQKDAVDDDLRTSLWSLLSMCFWDHWDFGRSRHDPDSAAVDTICRRLWFSYFKKPLDTLPPFRQEYGDGCYGELRKYFFSCNWYEMYDFIEFIIKSAPDKLSDEFNRMANDVLERENSAYRIVGSEFVEITSAEEIAAVDEALEAPYEGVRAHLQTSIHLVSDRKKPDYRNSIKESISAVESLVRVITNEENVTLGAGLKKLKDKVPVHPALEKGFLAIYGFTSDSNGIRHALLDQPTVDHADAKFMLVACSAFINFVIEKYK